MTEMTTPITALYAGILAILLIVLGGLVVRTRVRERVSLGDNGNKAMLAAMRIHANAVENIPMALLLLLLLEINGGSSTALHAYGIALTTGRFSHAWGMSRKNTVNRWRQGGMVLTWLTMGGLAVSLLVKVTGG